MWDGGLLWKVSQMRHRKGVLMSSCQIKKGARPNTSRASMSLGPKKVVWLIVMIVAGGLAAIVVPKIISRNDVNIVY